MANDVLYKIRVDGSEAEAEINRLIKLSKSLGTTFKDINAGATVDIKIDAALGDIGKLDTAAKAFLKTVKDMQSKAVIDLKVRSEGIKAVESNILRLKKIAKDIEDINVNVKIKADVTSDVEDEMGRQRRKLADYRRDTSIIRRGADDDRRRDTTREDSFLPRDVRVRSKSPGEDEGGGRKAVGVQAMLQMLDQTLTLAAMRLTGVMMEVWVKIGNSIQGMSRLLTVVSKVFTGITIVATAVTAVLVYAQKLVDSARELSNAFGKGFKESMGLKGYIELGGSIRELTKRYEVDAEELITVITRVAKLYKLGFKEVTEGLDAGMRSLTAKQRAEFLDQVSEYGTQFRKLGISAEDMFTSIGTGIKLGVLDKIPDMIKEFSIIRSEELFKESAETINRVGLTDLWQKNLDGAISYVDFHQQVVDKMKEMKAAGEDITPVLKAVWGTPGEDIGEAILLIDIFKESLAGLEFTKAPEFIQYSKDINEQMILMAKHKDEFEAAFSKSSDEELAGLKLAFDLYRKGAIERGDLDALIITNISKIENAEQRRLSLTLFFTQAQVEQIEKQRALIKLKEEDIQAEKRREAATLGASQRLSDAYENLGLTFRRVYGDWLNDLHVKIINSLVTITNVIESVVSPSVGGLGEAFHTVIKYVIGLTELLFGVGPIIDFVASKLYTLSQKIAQTIYDLSGIDIRTQTPTPPTGGIPSGGGDPLARFKSPVGGDPFGRSYLEIYGPNAPKGVVGGEGGLKGTGLMPRASGGGFPNPAGGGAKDKAGQVPAENEALKESLAELAKAYNLLFEALKKELDRNLAEIEEHARKALAELASNLQIDFFKIELEDMSMKRKTNDSGLTASATARKKHELNVSYSKQAVDVKRKEFEETLKVNEEYLKLKEEMEARFQKEKKAIEDEIARSIGETDKKKYKELTAYQAELVASTKRLAEMTKDYADAVKLLNVELAVVSNKLKELEEEIEKANELYLESTRDTIRALITDTLDLKQAIHELAIEGENSFKGFLVDIFKDTSGGGFAKAVGEAIDANRLIQDSLSKQAAIVKDIAIKKELILTIEQEIAELEKDPTRNAKKLFLKKQELDSTKENLAASEENKAITKLNLKLNVAKAGIRGLGSILEGIVSFENLFVERQLLNIDKIIGKRDEEIAQLTELSEANKKLAEEEDARYKLLVEINNVMVYQRMKELEDIKEIIPDAEKEALNEHIERERLKLLKIEEGKQEALSEEEIRIAYLQKLNEEDAAKKVELQKKQFEIDKKGKIISAIINTALAVASAASMQPFIPLAIISMAAAATAGTVAVATIASQPNPYHKGTLSVPGGDSSKDSVYAYLTPGEAVIPANINKEYSPAIRAIFNKEIPSALLNDFILDFKRPETHFMKSMLLMNNSNQIDNVGLSKAIKEGRTQVHVNVDEAGIGVMLQKANNRTTYLNKKLNGVF